MSVACIPKTIDNDIGVIDRSFGFNTAVAEARKAISSVVLEAQCAPNGAPVPRPVCPSPLPTPPLPNPSPHLTLAYPVRSPPPPRRRGHREADGATRGLHLRARNARLQPGRRYVLPPPPNPRNLPCTPALLGPIDSPHTPRLPPALSSLRRAVCLIPEVRFHLHGKNGLLNHVHRVLAKQRSCVIVVAEGAGDDLLAASAERDESGNAKLGDVGHFMERTVDDYFKQINVPGQSATRPLRNSPLPPTHTHTHTPSTMYSPPSPLLFLSLSLSPPATLQSRSSTWTRPT